MSDRQPNQSRNMPIKVKGFEHYIIHDNGKITKGNNIIKPTLSNGYLNVSLKSKNGEKILNISLAKLVAMHFVDKSDDSHDVVNHINGDVFNNNASNLEWCTQRQNVRHALDTALNKGNAKKIVQMDLDGNDLNTFDSTKDAIEHINSNPKNKNITCNAISKVLNGKNKSAGGYKWRYLNQEDNAYVNVDPSKLKKIPNYNDYYADKNGNIYKKVKNNKFRLMKPMKNYAGYYYVTLCKDKFHNNRYIHKLIALTFNENVNEK